MAAIPHDTTLLLARAAEGDRGASSELVERLYTELRQIASALLRGKPEGGTLSPTVLVHEAYLRLVDQTRANFQDRLHFRAYAATVMRRIAVDHHRRSHGRKSSGDDAEHTAISRIRFQLDENTAAPAGGADAIDVLALDETLKRLAQLDQRQATVVELRFFGGLSVDEAAECLGVSPRTVDGDWKVARAWLLAELSRGTGARP